MEAVEQALRFVAGTPPSIWCQTFFLAAACAVLALQVLPESIRSSLVNYGARRPQPSPSPASAQGKSGQPIINIDKGLIELITDLGQVPHSWFWHFYFLSMSMSAFWAWQYAQRGNVMSFLLDREIAYGDIAAVSPQELGRVFLAFLMMAAQGTRRLWECFFVAKPGGSSPMWVVHWALGLGFYAVMSVSVWIQGAGCISESWKTQTAPVLLSTRVPSTFALFAISWFKQNECHRYLASLKKYTLPDQGMFKYIVCPHYTCECGIYLSIAAMAAPSGGMFSKPVLSGLVFVAVNLGATARGTRQWYAAKFGAAQVMDRWMMIPYIF